MTIKPTPLVLQYAPWSVSKADTLRNCPRKFRYQYIDKVNVKEMGLRAPNAGDALVGKAVHKLLEYALLLNRPATGFTDTVLGEYKLNDEEIARFRALVPSADSLVAKLKVLWEKWGVQSPKIEQKIAVDINGKAVDFFDNSRAFFRGVLDLSVRIRDKNHLVVFDHKTGKDRGVGYYESQFDGYRWLVKGLYPELEGVQVAVNFLQTNRIEFAAFKYLHDAGELSDRVVAFLNKATAKAGDIDATRTGPLCMWCDYYSICPAHATDGTHGQENKHDTDGEDTNP